MPKLARGAQSGGPRRGHGFEVASDPAMLRRALVAKVTRTDESVVFDLAPGEVGHAFPTGDLFRRLLLVAEVVGDDYQLVAHAEHALGRHFRFETGAHGGKFQRELSDDRVQNVPQQVDLRIGPLARGQPIRWRIEWQRVQVMHEEHAVIADTVMIASGAIWAHGLWGRYWAWDPVETWSLIAWLIYGVNLHLRFTLDWKGRKAAWLALFSVVTIVITFFGIGVVSQVHTELLR